MYLNLLQSNSLILRLGHLGNSTICLTKYTMTFWSILISNVDKMKKWVMDRIKISRADW